MPRRCKPRVIYLCDCGLYNDQSEEKQSEKVAHLSTAEGVEHARQQVLDLTDALENVSEADKTVIAALIIDSATGADNGGALDLDAVRDAIDALASDNSPSFATHSAKSIARQITGSCQSMGIEVVGGSAAAGTTAAVAGK